MTIANTTAMGIQEFQGAIANGAMTVAEVVAVLDQRIAKRQAAGKGLIAKVVTYRNELVASLNAAGGASLPAVPVPTFIKAQANSALPTDPDSLADVVFATVGAAGIGQVVARLTARLIGA